MSVKVCLYAKTLYYPTGGGHLWVYLNWALGLRALGCQVIWLEAVFPWTSAPEVQALVTALKHNLEPYGLAESVALCCADDQPLPETVQSDCLDLEAATEADLLLNMRYGMPSDVVKRFRRSVLLDIDPGLLQTWISARTLEVAPHDMYFTIGETVGKPGTQIPDLGLEWHYTPPCVALNWWTPHPTTADAPFTTVSHWSGDEWMEDKGEVYTNDKRTGFLPYFDLPQQTNQALELALCLGDNEQNEVITLQEKGWRIRHSLEISSTPQDYQHYIQNSRGEFSCVKPSCIRLQNAWISDRTICYLASGKPAIVQNTGPSQFLPDSAGLFRFNNLEQATRCLEKIAADYEQQCHLARALAEKYFDAQKVTKHLLEKVLL
ncbi:MAG: hypothetical protein KME49_10275 [Brasilonema octagenarum HA4186-MV1]|jgi:hypothetical protein|nr:hypothetical protein [Brasilonema octagenarum HA4186-MV1]